MISVYYFSEIGFIIIPIATTISSWFNAIFLFVFLKNKNLFNFNNIFLIRFIKIIFASIAMGVLFNFLITYFDDELSFNQNLKSFYLIFSVLLGLLFYLFISYPTLTFKMIDIKLKY